MNGEGDAPGPRDIREYGVLLAMTDEQLYRRLGEEVAPAVSGLDPKLLYAIGSAWFTSRLHAIREAVCGSATVAAIRRATGSDEAVLVSAIADALAPLLHGPAVTTVAVLVVRYGIVRLCQET